jgi:hypothetical protein
LKSVKSLQQLGCLSRPELSIATPVGRPDFFPREKDLIRFVGYFQSSSVFGTSIGSPSATEGKTVFNCNGQYDAGCAVLDIWW